MRGRGARAELRVLGRTSNASLDDLRPTAAALRETTAAKERLEGKPGAAGEIQMGVIPKLFPAFAAGAERSGGIIAPPLRHRRRVQARASEA